MDVPATVEKALGDEDVAARVSIGGDDALFVTPTRTLIHRGEGLLSDEAVEVYDHAVERIAVSEGRRKSTIELTDDVGDTDEFTVPSSYVDEVLLPLLAGVLHHHDITKAAESVLHLHRFEELTLVITSERLVKHVGESVWDLDFSDYPFEDVTRVDSEEGSVSTQIVIEVDGRPDRIKTPTDEAPKVQKHLTNAIRAFHGLGEGEDLNAALAPDEDIDEDAAEEPASMSFGEGVEPLDSGSPGSTTTEEATAEDGEPAKADTSVRPADDIRATDAITPDNPGAETDTAAEDDDLAAAGFEPADESTPEVASEIAALREAVERQNALLKNQQSTIEQLIEELRRGR